jgi:hypothetical protein
VYNKPAKSDSVFILDSLTITLYGTRKKYLCHTIDIHHTKIT